MFTSTRIALKIWRPSRAWGFDSPLQHQHNSFQSPKEIRGWASPRRHSVITVAVSHLSLWQDAVPQPYRHHAEESPAPGTKGCNSTAGSNSLSRRQVSPCSFGTLGRRQVASRRNAIGLLLAYSTSSFSASSLERRAAIASNVWPATFTVTAGFFWIFRNQSDASPQPEKTT